MVNVIITSRLGRMDDLVDADLLGKAVLVPQNVLFDQLRLLLGLIDFLFQLIGAESWFVNILLHQM